MSFAFLNAGGALKDTQGSCMMERRLQRKFEWAELPPLGVVKKEVAVLIILVRRHRRAYGAAVRRVVDDEAPVYFLGQKIRAKNNKVAQRGRSRIRRLDGHAIFAWSDLILDRSRNFVGLQSPAACATRAVGDSGPNFENCGLFHAQSPDTGRGVHARSWRANRYLDVRR